MASLQELLAAEGLEDKTTSNADGENYNVEHQDVDEAYGSRSSGSRGSTDRQEEEEAALGRAAIKAVVSIVTGHLERFFEDGSFRASTHRRCLISLGEEHVDGAVADLKGAMRAVERAAVDDDGGGRSGPAEAARRAALELSAIAAAAGRRPSSADEPPAGIAACAHLYLGLVHKLRKDDVASAKHVLRVFRDATNQARTTLLPELWERLFLPHMCHLKEWFDEESESISGAKNWKKKIELLEELYIRILDAGTYQLAVYYKDWLEGTETSSDLPPILVPDLGRGGLPRSGDPSSEKEERDRIDDDSEKELQEEPATGEDEQEEEEEDQDTASEAPESFDGSSVPRDLRCPLTGQLFRDPVTLETGQTYERSAIADWFARSGKRTCPVTRRPLQTRSLPDTNFVVQSLINGLKSERRRNLTKKQEVAALCVVEQLLTDFRRERRTENAKYVLSLGGLQFLLGRFELGDVEEKSRAASLMLRCIEADGSCRSFLAANVAKTSILELLHSKYAGARTAVVSLLVELICLERRTWITSFLHGLRTEAILDTVHVLLVHLQSSRRHEERALVAVLLLHFDLMAESRRYSVYREEAVDSITTCLDRCLSDDKAVPSTRRALLMLAGWFSSSGEVVTETWLLKQAGFSQGSGVAAANCEDAQEDEDEVEAKAREDWLRTVSLVLVGSGKRSFLVTLSRCLGSENVELVSLCLAMVAWLSHSLSSLALAEAQISALSAFVPKLKETLVSNPQTGHRVLAAVSLFNLSKISKCRALLETFVEDMQSSLESLAEATWTARRLHAVICTDPSDSAAKTSPSKYLDEYFSPKKRISRNVMVSMTENVKC